MNNYGYILSAGLEFFFALISVILLIGCLLDHDKNRKVNKIMIAILCIHTLMNVIDACIWLWCDVPKLLTLMKIFSFLSYALGSAIIALFSLLLVFCIREYTPVPKWIEKTIISASAIMILLCVISVFNGMYYYWDENGACQIGDMFWLGQILGVLFFVCDIILILHYRESLSKKALSVFIMYCGFPLISYIFMPVWDVVPLYMATTIVLLLYYIIIHVEHGQRMAEQQTKLVQQELELTNSRTAILLTQIRPHFLYNSLSAIAQLCEKNPEKAKETTLNFSEYLRINMNSLEQKSPIDFTKELEHIKTYLAIEQIRFADDLKIKYNITATDFKIPALSLQPIVENAVKHGVGMKENGGTVNVSSKETTGFYEITVSDDGVGFDVNAKEIDDKKHLGMRLVKERLEKMVDGTLHIESHQGSGTTVTICIPKGMNK